MVLWVWAYMTPKSQRVGVGEGRRGEKLASCQDSPKYY